MIPARVAYAAGMPDSDVESELDKIAAELAGVEAALERLDAGTYWTDEVTGEPLPDELLSADPVARRAPTSPPTEPPPSP
jgi:RNA polymerase-binding transcription factor DksA